MIHCDANVLHAPEDGCIYCNMHPDLQQERITNRVNFTGHHNPEFSTCPSEEVRPLEKINLWHGNVIVREGDPLTFYGLPISELKDALRGA